MYKPVSYTHLRAHETDSYLFVGSVKMCIRDSFYIRAKCNSVFGEWSAKNSFSTTNQSYVGIKNVQTCLLYTSPSPRDGLLSIRRQRQDVYKRQLLYSC